MNARERGFLLLTSCLGDPQRHPLSVAQLRVLTERVAASERPSELRELEPRDIVALGYGREMAERIVRLLAEEAVLEHYLRRGEKAGCGCISRISAGYPTVLRQRLGAEAPGCLWYKGNLQLLEGRSVALVGSRDIRPENLAFAREVGRQAALQGYTLVSGNARGADRAAQESCLDAGGAVICVVADEMERHSRQENMLYLSEDGFDLAFTGQRALSRNRIIHCLGRCSFVAQSAYRIGGTWNGTVKNLRFGWNPVFCFRDGSEAAEELVRMGGSFVDLNKLGDFSALCRTDFSLFDQ